MEEELDMGTVFAVNILHPIQILDCEFYTIKDDSSNTDSIVEI